jgi:hypothetical protein
MEIPKRLSTTIPITKKIFCFIEKNKILKKYTKTTLTD